ncbi:PP2C family protein-serine/threonine phosphatase [Streptomyces sp. NPDC058108]|uniref:PP2C family protein-serine/threonine phosphatase n=1 Tax=unclassified Streptomyces TaxID=2593676 RepID=UPI0036E4B0AE
MSSLLPYGRDHAPVLTMTLGTERDVFMLRRHAKTVADAVGLDSRDQVRLATALSELGRDLLRAAPMTATFTVRRPAALRVVLRWSDDRTPSSESLAAVTRLLSQTLYQPPRPSAAPGPASDGWIDITCLVPVRTGPAMDLARVRALLAADSPATAIDDLQAQTRDLMAALQEAHAQRDELERLNEELTETNAGVMAMYAELTVEHKDVVERFGEEHQLALTLQRSFLPVALPTSAGLELAVRYLPAASETEIGGDFYDAIPTPHGLLLAVGDVVGHSLQAATVMGELRHALRAYATQDHPPHVLLQHLDRYLHLYHRGWTATVCLILVEPGNRRIQIANAGHLPPLLISADNSSRYLTEHGPLLGLNLSHPTATTTPITPGDRLLMVTDGLVENRTHDLYQRMETLGAAASSGPTQPEDLCDALLHAFATEPEDDIIVFAALIHTTSSPPGHP